MAMYFSADPAWTALPGAAAGCLVVRGVENPPASPALESAKLALLERLRARYGGRTRAVIAAIPPIDGYVAWYRRFEKTYHVLAQIESVALRGKPLPRVAALVEAMFMAELESALLTAGHDLDTLALPVTVGSAAGDERYTLLKGEERAVTAGDLLMRDGVGIISTVLQGPDARTQITPATRNVLFAVYAPPGVDRASIRPHLELILSNVRLVVPGAAAEAMVVL